MASSSSASRSASSGWRRDASIAARPMRKATSAWTRSPVVSGRSTASASSNRPAPISARASAMPAAGEGASSAATGAGAALRRKAAAANARQRRWSVVIMSGDPLGRDCERPGSVSDSPGRAHDARVFPRPAPVPSCSRPVLSGRHRSCSRTRRVLTRPLDFLGLSSSPGHQGGAGTGPGTPPSSRGRLHGGVARARRCATESRPSPVRSRHWRRESVRVAAPNPAW